MNFLNAFSVLRSGTLRTCTSMVATQDREEMAGFGGGVRDGCSEIEGFAVEVSSQDLNLIVSQVIDCSAQKEG